MDIFRLYALAGKRVRKKRMEWFREVMKPTPETRILDIGGLAPFWHDTGLRVTLLNIDGRGDIHADATAMPLADGSYDIAFSNSVIEHLHTREHQELAAKEAMRVGRRLWIQTPNRWFPIEPHYLTPFVHWLPKSWRMRLARNFTVWGLVARPSPEFTREVVDEIRLLTARELREMFPGCKIIRERFLGLTKSLIVIR